MKPYFLFQFCTHWCVFFLTPTRMRALKKKKAFEKNCGYEKKIMQKYWSVSSQVIKWRIVLRVWQMFREPANRWIFAYSILGNWSNAFVFMRVLSYPVDIASSFMLYTLMLLCTRVMFVLKSIRIAVHICSISDRLQFAHSLTPNSPPHARTQHHPSAQQSFLSRSAPSADLKTKSNSNRCVVSVNMSVDEEKWQVNIVIWHLTK